MSNEGGKEINQPLIQFVKEKGSIGVNWDATAQIEETESAWPRASMGTIEKTTVQSHIKSKAVVYKYSQLLFSLAIQRITFESKNILYFTSIESNLGMIPKSFWRSGQIELAERKIVTKINWKVTIKNIHLPILWKKIRKFKTFHIFLKAFFYSGEFWGVWTQ